MPTDLPLITNAVDVNRRRGHTWCLLAIFYLYAIILGVRVALFSTATSQVDLMLQLGFTICLGWWAIEDARRRQQPIPFLSRQWFVLFAGIVVPVYVIWTRGWRGVGWLVLLFTLWFLLIFSCALAAMILHAVFNWLAEGNSP